MAMKSPYRIQVAVQLLSLLAIALAILATVCDARRNAPLAGIFGINGDRGKKNGQQNANGQQQQQQQQRPPPPPKKTGGTRAFGLPGSTPPPPPKKHQDRQSSQQSSPPPPPPRSKSLQTAKESTNKLSLSKDEAKSEVTESSKASVENSTITDGGETPLVATKEYRGDGQIPLQPPGYSGQSAAWQGQEGVPQQQYDYDYGYDPNHLYYLQEELNDSLAREHSLVAQIHNLTDVTLALEQREFLHKQQLDVLTEKVVDVENRAAADRNLVIEYEANCTALGTTIEALRDDVEEWRTRCDEWSKKHQEDEETLSELRQAIKEKKSEAEDLAIAMEDLRMIEERRREQAIHPKSSSKSGGLLSWMFSLLIGKKPSKRYENDDEIRADAFEMAKSTLLRALQSERMNVHELESAVVSLQQNNSAISGMVESRDNVIDELNNRIAVFEEDKVTLKAALRELQREMKEEEPKAQKLIANLADAEHEIERLKEDYHSIVETHQDELSKLRNAMSQKQSTITEAESNLTAIGTYVDKLEDRLTSFAMTRRDMETREKKCKEIETKAQETELQRAAIAKEIEELKQREDEVKTVMVELAENRTKLLQENRRLYTEQEFRIGEIEKLTSRIDVLETESASMREEVGEWKSKCENLGFDLEGSQTNSFNLKQQVEELSGAQKQLDTLKLEKRAVTEINEKLREEIADAKKEKEEMEAKLNELSNEIKRRQTAEKAAPPSPKSNDVPLRSVRKAFSKATGLHGVLTPSSSKGGEK